ncbi:MAG: fluoride efflux transporter CrcB [Weeksellaceae bacterium]|nr:fluoride efflux transporter CrcB [Weeksellaceae bacterium]
MRTLIYIFLGGGFGSVMRFLISNYTQKWWSINAFPVGTFVVNMTGCFFIGLLSAYFMKVDNSLKYLLITGFCGGYTTFSAFSSENFSLWQSGNYAILVFYAFASFAVGLLMVFLGFQMLRNQVFPL